MSYGSPKPTRARSGGGGMIFIVILMVGAFILFSNRGGTGQSDQENSPENVLGGDGYEQGQQREDTVGGGGDFVGRPMPSNRRATDSGDWEIEDVATGKSADSTTTSGDWSIEDVDNRNSKDKNQFQFSQESTSTTQKPESGGDWSIEDAGAKTKATQNKKTEKGDWSIEETNTKKDK